MKIPTLAAAGLILAVYLVAAVLLHHEEAKKRADFTLCPLCGEKVTVNQ
jgi:hypothetical protein